MKINNKFFVIVLSSAVFLELLFLLLLLGRQYSFPLLDPKGIVSQAQRDLILFSSGLALIGLLPVFVILFLIYRRNQDNEVAELGEESEEESSKIKLLWWAFPSIIIAILAVVTWTSTHQLDPRKPIESANKPLEIEVVALQWKWLFIYPEQKIATVNFVQFPKDTPVNFKLTADAPMNSFWIPQLGGQIYAMAGMRTNLQLMATETGEFAGQSAELSGPGFSGMKFKAKATSSEEFEKWTQAVQLSPNDLDLEEYNKLSLPSENNLVAYYSLAENDIYNNVMLKFTGGSHVKGGH